MSKAPIWPVATDALVADTTHLSAEEFGAYTLLMIAQWRSNGAKLPADEARLARMARLSPRAWARVRPVLAELFEVGADGWSQKRVEKDFANVSEKIEANRENGSRGGKAKSLKSNKLDVATATNSPQRTASENVAIHEPYPEPEDTSSLRSDVCAEPSATAPPSKPNDSPPFIALETNIRGHPFVVSEAVVEQFRGIYPAVDVEQALRGMQGWLIANPGKRKTSNGMMRFVNTWLSKEQDKGHRNGTNRTHHNGNDSARNSFGATVSECVKARAAEWLFSGDGGENGLDAGGPIIEADRSTVGTGDAGVVSVRVRRGTA